MSCCIENLCLKTDVEPFLRVLPAYQYYSTRLLLLSLFCSWNHFLILELGIAFPNQLHSRSFPCEFSTRLLRESGISFVSELVIPLLLFRAYIVELGVLRSKQRV